MASHPERKDVRRSLGEGGHSRSKGIWLRAKFPFSQNRPEWLKSGSLTVPEEVYSSSMVV